MPTESARAIVKRVLKQRTVQTDQFMAAWTHEIMVALQTGGYDILPWPPAAALVDCDGGPASRLPAWLERDIDHPVESRLDRSDIDGPAPLGCDGIETFDNDDGGA